MNIEAELTRIFAEDELGLFDIKPKKSFVKTSDQRLIDSFEGINAFVVPEESSAASSCRNRIRKLEASLLEQIHSRGNFKSPAGCFELLFGISFRSVFDGYRSG